VHSAVFLASTLLAVRASSHASCEFLGRRQVIVYVGESWVIRIVIMLISLERSLPNASFNRQWMMPLVAAAALIVEFAMAFTAAKIPLCFPPWPTRRPLQTQLTVIPRSSERRSLRRICSI